MYACLPTHLDGDLLDREVGAERLAADGHPAVHGEGAGQHRDVAEERLGRLPVASGGGEKAVDYRG